MITNVDTLRFQQQLEKSKTFTETKQKVGSTGAELEEGGQVEEGMREGLLGRYTPYKIAGGNVSSLNSAQTCRNLRKSRQHAVSYFSTQTVEEI